MPFEIYREQYVSPARLGFKNHWAETLGRAGEPARRAVEARRPTRG